MATNKQNEVAETEFQKGQKYGCVSTYMYIKTRIKSWRTIQNRKLKQAGAEVQKDES